MEKIDLLEKGQGERCLMFTRKMLEGMGEVET